MCVYVFGLNDLFFLGLMICLTTTTFEGFEWIISLFVLNSLNSVCSFFSPGLTSHPSRPFLLASSSRDSTVRLWSVTSLVQPVELSVLAGKPTTELSGSGGTCSPISGA